MIVSSAASVNNNGFSSAEEVRGMIPSTELLISGSLVRVQLREPRNKRPISSVGLLRAHSCAHRTRRRTLSREAGPSSKRLRRQAKLDSMPILVHSSFAVVV